MPLLPASQRSPSPLANRRVSARAPRSSSGPSGASGGASNDVGSTLPHYIARVQAIQPLSREEEYELACRVRDPDGDAEAARKLVEANLRYVVAIALSYRRYGVRLADLISEGNVGLMIALKKFDPARGTRFVTYAAHWIRAYVLDHVIRAWSIVGRRRGAAALEGVLPAPPREGEDPRLDERLDGGQRAARRALRNDDREDRAAGQPPRSARRVARREGVRRRRGDGARHRARPGPSQEEEFLVARAIDARCTPASATRSRSSTRASGSSSRCG